jgi:hypothetical protein
MRQNIQEYYRVLGLNPGVGPLEIRRAYRHMVQHWHPDLFKPGSPMQATAEDITKEINNAFEQLYRKKLYRKFLPKTDYSPETDPTQSEPTPAAAAGEKAAAPEPPPEQEPPKPARKRRRPVIRAWIARKLELLREGKLFRRPKHIPWARATALAGLAVLVVPIWQKTHEPAAVERAIEADATLQADPSDGSASTRSSDEPRASATNPETMIVRDPTTDRNRNGPSDRTATGSSDVVLALNRSASERYLQTAEATLDVFELGDPKAKVLAIQGPPDEASENVLRYGSSIVYLQSGLVSGWSDQLPRLHIRKWTTIEGALDTFAFGSTMLDVVRAQGIPTTFSPSSYTYGSSVIYFENDRVAAWSEADVPLRAFNMPVSPFIDLARFNSPSLPTLDDFRVTPARSPLGQNSR